jgi:hypothetical protein
MEDEYINLEDLIEEKKKLYQIQLNDNKLIIKNVGYGMEAPEMIIQENIGKNKDLSIYNCILTENELLNLCNKNSYLPVIKLLEKKGENENIYFISVKIEKIELDKNTELFETYYILHEGDKKTIKYKKLDKNINSKNIIEILLEHYYC